MVGLRWKEVVLFAVGSMIMTASQPGFPSNVVYCRPDLNPWDSRGLACGAEPTTIFERTKTLIDDFSDPDPRVGRPNIIQVFERLLPDQPVEK